MGSAPASRRGGVGAADRMRKQEWSTLLLPEQGESWRRPTDPVDLVLQACAKYRRRRVVYVPIAALRMLDAFLLLERPDLVRRSARALTARRAELFVVDRIDHATGRLGGVLDGVRRTFAMEAMSPALRRITVRETGDGLEALAVFLGHGGLMLGPSSWDRIRLDAWRRMQRHAADDPLAPVLPPRPWRFHDLRHSFCLQLLKYLMRLTIDREGQQPRGLPSLPEHVAFRYGTVQSLSRLVTHRQKTSPANSHSCASSSAAKHASAPSFSSVSLWLPPRSQRFTTTTAHCATNSLGISRPRLFRSHERPQASAARCRLQPSARNRMQPCCLAALTSSWDEHGGAEAADLWPGDVTAKLLWAVSDHSSDPTSRLETILIGRPRSLAIRSRNLVDVRNHSLPALVALVRLWSAASSQAWKLPSSSLLGRSPVS